jgi:ribosomal protein S18 acetylase RimI-like enzyme
MTVRPAVSADQPTLVSFQLKMAAETENLQLDATRVAQGVQAVLTDKSKGEYFVVEQAGSVVACLLITFEWSDWRCGQVWWIQSVYVAPEVRNRGVFRLLYSHIKQLAEADPAIRGIRLYVDKSNQHAQRVYERLGMNGDHYYVFEWMK